MENVKNICIFLFSGTGMTKYVIERIKYGLEVKQVSVDIFLIENVILENILLNNYDILGIAYPVHAFNAPKKVIDFIKKLSKVNFKNTFLISTTGETNIINNSCSKLLIKILSKKGYYVFYDKQFEMPANLIVKDNETKVESKINKIKEETPNTVNNILNIVSQKQYTNIISDIMAIIGKLELLGLLISGKLFYVNKECISCGICAVNCPNKNIILIKKSAKINRHCGLCMRCIYLCPRRSIKTYWIFKFISFDKWYENKELSINKIKKIMMYEK